MVGGIVLCHALLWHCSDWLVVRKSIESWKSRRAPPGFMTHGVWEQRCLHLRAGGVEGDEVFRDIKLLITDKVKNHSNLISKLCKLCCSQKMSFGGYSREVIFVDWEHANDNKKCNYNYDVSHWHALSTYSAPNTILGSLHILSKFIPTISYWLVLLSIFYGC